MDWNSQNRIQLWSSWTFELNKGKKFVDYETCCTVRSYNLVATLYLDKNISWLAALQNPPIVTNITSSALLEKWASPFLQYQSHKGEMRLRLLQQLLQSWSWNHKGVGGWAKPLTASCFKCFCLSVTQWTSAEGRPPTSKVTKSVSSSVACTVLCHVNSYRISNIDPTVKYIFMGLRICYIFIVYLYKYLYSLWRSLGKCFASFIISLI